MDQDSPNEIAHKKANDYAEEICPLPKNQFDEILKALVICACSVSLFAAFVRVSIDDHGVAWLVASSPWPLYIWLRNKHTERKHYEAYSRKYKQLTESIPS